MKNESHHPASVIPILQPAPRQVDSENLIPEEMPFQGSSKVRSLELKLNKEKIKTQKRIAETIIRVTEKERSRIGRELHDNINQILSCAKLYYDQLSPFSEKENDFKRKGQELILLAIEEIRNLSKELVCSRITGKNFAEHMKALVLQTQSVAPIRIQFECLLEGRSLTSDKAIMLYRILQEQLKNILLHSRASEVMIYLQINSRYIHFIVSDNGVGIQPNNNSNGIGISNIRERVSSYNGKFIIRAKPGEGYRMLIWIPRKRADSKNLMESSLADGNDIESFLVEKMITSRVVSSEGSAPANPAAAEDQPILIRPSRIKNIA